MSQGRRKLMRTACRCQGPTAMSKALPVYLRERVVAADALNRMLDLGRPEYVRIA